jgi:2-dehydropantoate 2-reductase
MDIRNIYIFGIGGTGGLIGSRVIQGLKDNAEVKIFFIARGAHCDAIKDHGLILESEKETVVSKPAAAASEPKDMPIPDLCILCVKSYDLEDACRLLKDRVAKETLIIPILNGVDIYERMRKVIDTGIILPGCVYLNAFVKQPGTIKHLSGDLIVYGRDPRHPDHKPEHLIRFLTAIPDITFRWEDDPYPSIWEKYMFVAAYALVTSYARQTIRRVYENEELKQMVSAITAEIKNIASEKGYSFRADIVEKLVARGGVLPPDATTSYQRDIANKNGKNEGDIFGETIIRMGKELHVPTPVTNRICDALTEIYSY